MRLFIVTCSALLTVTKLSSALGSIISFSNDQNEDGSYAFAYETENGIKVEESGVQQQIGENPDEIGTASKGSYSYTSLEGQVISAVWTAADEFGFQVTCAHLPVSPVMPSHVIKMLGNLKVTGRL